MARNCKCPHLDNTVLQLSLAELCRLKQGVPCSQCDVTGPNLWICLNKSCLHIGCSENYNDHSTKHYRHNPSHCIHMNQSSQRIWCYKCEMEVFIVNILARRQPIDNDVDHVVINNNNNNINRYAERVLSGNNVNNILNGGFGNSITNDLPSTIKSTESPTPSTTTTTTIGDTSTTMANGDFNGDSSADDDCDSDQMNYSNSMGLVGLQNIANTCYMNAALQALSNTPPLTGYFIECGDIIEANYEMTTAANNQRKTGLAKSYCRLVKEMWLQNKRNNGKYGYVVPNGILYGIRNVHPMFRGFQQHDTQEFLRCFMDQLHEELKEVTPLPPDLIMHTITSSNSNPILNINSNSNITTNFLPTAHNYLHLGSSDDDYSGCSTPSLSQSEAEYETCDSGVSEQSSLSDEVSSVPRSLPLMINGNASTTTTTTNKSISQRYSDSLDSKYSPKYSPNFVFMDSKSNRSNSISSLNSLTLTNSSQQPQSQQSTGQQSPIDPEQSPSQQSDKSESSTAKLSHRSIISDVFDGQLLSSVQCLTCDRISTREETFQDLSLPIPGKDHLNVLHHSQGSVTPLPVSGLTVDLIYSANQDGWFSWLWNWFRSFFWGPAVTLHDCMSAFFSADELKGDNMYSCEKCNKLRNGMKFSRVLELPEMLCVHLKRFRHDLSYSSKISSPVNFPLVGLDMRPYLHKECKSNVSTYDLTAVICHHGTVGGGHYTSFAKHEITGKWFEFDDQLVTEVSPEVVQNCEAYVLFYRKSNPQMSMIREQAMQIEDLSAEQTSGIRFYVSRQWLNKFKTFAEPGPIDNWTFICPHGGLSPKKARMKNRLVVPLPQALWDFLYEKFGGGPACNHLFECDVCRQQADALTRRQNFELDEFSAYKDETTSTIYAISMAWFRQWQLFVGAVTDEEPGPINNSSIALQSDGPISRGVKPGSDYAQINSTLWQFFYNIYGGGPAIILRGNPSDEIIRSMSVPSASTSHKEVDDRISNELPAHKETPNINPNNNQAVQSTDQRSNDIDRSKTLPNQNGNSSTETNDRVHGNKDTNSQPMTITPSAVASALATNNTKKAQKNVSFEDNDSNSSDREGQSFFEQSFFYTRRGKHHYSTSPSTNGEILSKKDRRLRSSIKNNGFFGPEGKYSVTPNYDDSARLNQSTATNVTANDTNKKLEEITPLLHQASISPLNGNACNTEINSVSTNGNSNRGHKSSYRKRVKTKLSRKSA